MDLVAALGRTLGFSVASGVNLYATIAILGLAARYDWVGLPADYEVFADPWIIGGAIVLYLIEFVADKVPWVDSMWDSVHAFIRPIGGAFVAVAAAGEAFPGFDVLVGLAGGTVAAGSHLMKASTRVAVNASPEPFTNWLLSLAEDAFVIGLGLLAIAYPVAALGVSVLVLMATVILTRWIYRKIRGMFRPATT
jgi:hypothetical protein